jgi:quercetin dioxygenase-like cupin family protein
MQFMFHMIYVIEGEGALVNEKCEEKPLKAGDFALVDPDENTSTAMRATSPSR